MHIRLSVGVAFAVAWLISSTLAGEVGFSAKPAAVRDGKTVKITFTASATTDVEVAVLDGEGKTVRHLAAGVTGEKAPAPLKPGLAQELTWDGKDDFGKPAGDGPWRVCVSLGLKPTLDRMIGDNPGTIKCPQGIAVNANGELYVLHVYGRIHPDDATAFVTVFNRNGRYLRTILPYPASMPEEKLTGLKRATLGTGQKAPFIYQAETRSLIAGAGSINAHQPAVTPAGQFVFIGHQEKPAGTQLRYNGPGIKQVTVINADGSMPAAGPYRTVLASRSQSHGALAIAPDGKTFYAVGVSDGKAETPGAVVRRFSLDDKSPKPFIEKGLTNATCLTVDKDGNLLVADRGAGCIAMFKTDGTPAGEIKLADVFAVAVNHKSGAIYAVTSTEGKGREGNSYQLVKFASAKADAPAATLAIPAQWMGDREKYPTLAVDASAEPVVVWVGLGGGHFSVGDKGELFRVEEKDGEFTKPLSINSLPGNDKPSAGPVIALAANRANNTLLVGDRVYDITKDTWTKGLDCNVGSQKGVGSFGLDGNFYSQVYLNQVFRFGADLKPLPFEATGKNFFSRKEDMVGGGQEIRARGITADAAGNIYSIWNTGRREGSLIFSHNVAKYGPDGKPVNADLVDAGANVINCPRLDPSGNIYLAVAVRPAGVKQPADLIADFGKPFNKDTPSTEMEWYQLMYGSIVKFGPDGGVIRDGAGGVPVEFAWGEKAEIKGAKWMHFGASPIVSWRIGAPDTCFCESPRFDVDRYGRSFYPDAARFRVGVLDTAGNRIGEFGSYGNADSAGPKSAVPTPDIPFYWPYVIECVEDTLYIGDRMNRRIVVVRLDHAASATCEIK